MQDSHIKRSINDLRVFLMVSQFFGVPMGAYLYCIIVSSIVVSYKKRIFILGSIAVGNNYKDFLVDFGLDSHFIDTNVFTW